MIALLPRALACLIALPLLPAADLTVADSAVIAALQRAAPALPNAAIVRRMAVADGLDVVVALASRQSQVVGAGGRYGWSTQDRLGLFLQARSDPARIDKLAIEAGPNDDCAARIERITAQELVLSCVGEKWATYDNRKFVYDIRAKSVTSYFSYAPFGTAQVLPEAAAVGGGPRFVMADNRELLLVVRDRASGELRVAPAAEAGPVLARIPMVESTVGDQTFHSPAVPPDSAASFGPGLRFGLSKQKNQYGSEYTVIAESDGPDRKIYPLAQSDLATWQQARPDDAHPGGGSSPANWNPAEMNEEIGPHQLEGGRLWFGKTFYNSEGSTGVGGFGYFDTATAAYRLYSPPAIQRWSVSAILVEADCLWLALYRRGEYGNNSGGLLRWDRKSAEVRSFAVADVVTSIARAGQVIYLGSAEGIAALRGDRITSYLVDRIASGGYAIAERN